ncbi:DUF6204 family protein [Streptomyces sp. NPDC046977]|uniref:DUF6204 family protein n=1 Tax=Streptomyces sp. NPDC046977 TaxID=3154703 RepID=UPI0034073C08
MTDEGTLIYELQARNSTYRCVVRQPAAAVQRACDRAAAYLANRGIRHSTLRGTATGLDDMEWPPGGPALHAAAPWSGGPEGAQSRVNRRAALSCRTPRTQASPRPSRVIASTASR